MNARKLDLRGGGCETRLNSTMTVAYVGVLEIGPGTLFVVYSRSDDSDAFKYA